jgi:hypothetical protein
MKEEIKVLELDKYELGILINALNEFRNKMIKEGKDTEYVDEVLLRAIDAPPKKKVLIRSMRRDEYRF